MAQALKVIRIDEAAQVSFGPLSHYQALVTDDEAELDIRTGIQTAKPGYVAKRHYHPYVEILHVLQGEVYAWQGEDEANAVRLGKGDTLVIPANTWHSFRVTGDEEMRLLGTHMSPQRIVFYVDGTTSVMGRPT